MSVFDYDDYKAFVHAHLEASPKRGRGQFRRMADALGVHSTMMSHVFRGQVDLSAEQAATLADFFALSAVETEYFVALVQLSRAGSVALKKILLKRAGELRAQGRKVSSRIRPEKVLSEKDKALFYSEWFYSAIRLMSAIPGHHDLEIIAGDLGLPKRLVSDVASELLDLGLCRPRPSGGIEHAVNTTHVEADSPLANRHHKNWRMKAMESLHRLGEDELAFTMPVTLSESDIATTRKLLLEFIAKVDQVFEKSPAERLCCLNVDWVRIG